MEHLPQVTDAAFPPLQIPYVCSHLPFDRKGLADFPKRIGWQSFDNTSSFRPANSGRTEEEVSTLLQSWLYFGLLNEVLSVSGVLVKIDDFVRETEQGQRVIMTAALPGYLDEWERRERLLNEETQREHLRKVVTILSQANEAVNSNLGMSIPFDESFTPPRDIELSIMVLGETLTNAAAEIWPFWVDFVEPGEFGLRSHFGRWQSPITMTRMIQNSWCPSDVALLHQTLDQTGLYITSTLNRPVVQKHTECPWDKCLANDIDERVYRTKHTRHGCSCKHIVVDSEALSSIILRGVSPSIAVWPGKGGDGDVRIGITDSEPYVAISHVWSHGLGNARNNSLPRCQLLRLHSLISSLNAVPRSASDNAESAVSVWIDTLCIPVQKKHRASRKMSIQNLASIYRNADKVLVLDAELQQATSRCSTMEIAARILCSSWTQRLWTLQEGAMTGQGNLHYQFRDGVVGHPDLTSSHSSAQKTSQLYCSQVLFTAVAYRMPSWAYNPTLEMYDRFRGFSSALQYRTTSKVEDETICLASLLRFNTSDLLDKSSQVERLKAFFHLLDPQIPSNILFTPGPKLPDHGDRWIPTSLLSTSVSLFASPGPPASHDSDGLHAQYHGVFLLTDNCPVYRIFDFKLQHNGLWYSVSSPPHADEFCRNLHTLQRPALVLTQDLGRGRGVLVEVYREEQGVLFARFLYSAGIMDSTQSSTLDDQLVVEKGMTGQVRRKVVLAEWISDDQRWCIG